MILNTTQNEYNLRIITCIFFVTTLDQLKAGHNVAHSLWWVRFRFAHALYVVKYYYYKKETAYLKAVSFNITTKKILLWICKSLLKLQLYHCSNAAKL